MVKIRLRQRHLGLGTTHSFCVFERNIMIYFTCVQQKRHITYILVLSTKYIYSGLQYIYFMKKEDLS